MFASRSSLCYLLAFLALCVVIEAGVVFQIDGPCGQNCSKWMRCDATAVGDKVFTIVDGQCLVYENGCSFAMANCWRKSFCLSNMVGVTKAECQLICPTCGEDFDTSNPGFIPPLLSEIPA